MISNKILHINVNEINNILTQAKNNNYYIVTLDGRNIHSEQKYLDAMAIHFKFPYGAEGYDGYNDWIRDLSWLIDDGYKGFGLIIDYYPAFLDQDPEFKEYLNIRGFNSIASFWEYEVVKIVMEGKPHSFNIYLVDR